MLHGKKILITSGPTRAPLDAMRFISNRSTGRFGSLLANEALKKGAKVTFIYGRGSLTPRPHQHLKLIPVGTNPEVASVLKKELQHYHYDSVIHAMAVLDFQPDRIKKVKTKTKGGVWRLKLVPTPKIIENIKKWAPKILLVGFKLEVGVSKSQLLQRARQLLRKSRANFVLANQLTEGGDKTHLGFLLDASGRVIGQAKGKQKLARLIIEQIR